MEKTTFNEPLAFTFVNRWELMKPVGGSFMLRPITRSTDGAFRPFDCGFAMNQIVLEGLISQLVQAAKSVGLKMDDQRAIGVRADPSTGLVTVTVGMASGNEMALQLDSRAAVKLSQDLITAVTHLRS